MVKPWPICLGCQHVLPGDQDRLACAAFPQGIPKEILDGTIVHRNPYPGDQGLRYQPRPVRRLPDFAPTDPAVKSPFS